jgi:cell fate regulator YaaT (PSP1 superfamily)
MVTVEGVSGFDIGQISLTGELVKLQMKKKRIEDTPEVKKVLRRATNEDLARMNDNKAREKDALIKARAIARSIGLEMKLAEVEIQADGRKATFFYTADDRVDFRELIKLYAGEFRVKVEMRQIGARQEAGKVGGIGSCGRELCCSTWLTDFKSVNTTAARYQNLSINQAKLSGQCGRLKCCLNYELDTYLDALKEFPEDADSIETANGVATLQKRDIFKNLMWYSYGDSNKQYPLTIARVKEIRQLNKQNIRPEDLKPVEVVATKPKETDLGFADVVGQISLRSLEKTSQKRKHKDKEKQKHKQKQEQPQPQGGKKQEGKGETQNRPPQQQKQPQENRPHKQQDNRPQQQQQKPKQEQRPQQHPPKPKQEQRNQPNGPKPQQDKDKNNPNNPKQQGGGGHNRPPKPREKQK